MWLLLAVVSGWQLRCWSMDNRGAKAIEFTAFAVQWVQGPWLYDCWYYRAEGKGLWFLEMLTVKMQGCLCKVCEMLGAFTDQKWVCKMRQNSGNMGSPQFVGQDSRSHSVDMGEAKEKPYSLLWCLHLGQPPWLNLSCCPVEPSECKCSLPSSVAASPLGCGSSHTGKPTG